MQSYHLARAVGLEPVQVLVTLSHSFIDLLDDGCASV